jgi:polysaccharide biosynthesis protein PslH
MRILFLSTWFPYPPDNGSKIRAHYLIRALALRHTITVTAFQPAVDRSSWFPQEGANERVKVYSVAADPFRYTRLPAFCKFISLTPTVFWKSNLMKKAVDQAIRMESFDAIVAFQTPVARYALQELSLPRLLDADTLVSRQIDSRRPPSRGALSRGRSWLSRYKVRRFEASLLSMFPICTVVSPVDQSYIRDMGVANSCRVEVIPNGIDCLQNRPGLNEVLPDTLVFNGSLTYDANLDAMQYFTASILPLIERRKSNVILTITGAVSEAIAASLRATTSNVRLAGHVRDVRPLVANSAVCVVPIRIGSGTRIKILEAMALGTPVVATPKAVEGLEVENGIHLLIADSAAEFADSTLRLLRDASLARQLSHNARALVEQKYDWSIIGSRFTQLVEELPNGMH